MSIVSEFKELIGKTPVSIRGAEKGSDVVDIICSDDTRYRTEHFQDCCETVLVEDVTGDIEDLLNSPLVEAEEVTEEATDVSESGTWTFYKFRTAKGSVVIRWLGESNGYYSESVDFSRVK